VSGGAALDHRRLLLLSNSRRISVADLAEQFVRLVETAGGFGAAARLAVAVSPIRDARQHAGHLRN
jgi:hypothetical protein